MKPAGFGGQGQHGQRVALGILDRRGGAMHAALAQATAEVFFGKHVHQVVLGQGQAGAVGALHGLQQATAHRSDIQPAKVQGGAIGIGEIDMATRVIGQQAMHDLCGGGDQHAMSSQGSGQGFGGGKTVRVVRRINTGLDTAPPRIPDHLAHRQRALDLAGQTIAPRPLQRDNRAVIQRGRPQAREVIEVLHAERHAHLRLLMFMFLTCQYRHVIEMNTFCLNILIKL